MTSRRHEATERVRPQRPPSFSSNENDSPGLYFDHETASWQRIPEGPVADKLEFDVNF